jgi:hypothetical protein
MGVRFDSDVDVSVFRLFAAIFKHSDIRIG